MVPERAVQFPGLTAVGGSEKPPGNGAGPEHARLVGAAGFEDPDLLQGPGNLDLAKGIHDDGRIIGFLGILRRIKFLPGVAGIGRPVDLGPEVSVLDRRVERSIASIGEDGRHLDAEE